MKIVLSIASLSALCFLAACADTSGSANQGVSRDSYYSTSSQVSNPGNPQNGMDNAHKMMAPLTSY